MHLISVILIFISIIGIINPWLFIAEGSGGGRWVFIVIFFLGTMKIWSAIKILKRNKDDD
ncbi:hypothetical protein [Bartonella sp. A05]|uniref:hypothetical protein n=1 Tax=Bartonella sp. A05 TaxID=2967261 RepID=UPI0022A985F8|nr:hypothetical protein [Bartonella sp. A05]MCZ2203782.1 hypothetical protein [Bartonella sp. A05]